MTRLTHTVIPKQFSDFIREEYPRFIEFIQAYYKFLDSANSTAAIGSIKDIDETANKYIANYRKEFAIDIPKFDFLSDRSFIRFSRELYEARGTEDALRFLFRAAFNDEITIEYPKDWILRASAGRWFREWFFDVDVNLDVGTGLYNPTFALAYNITSGSPFYISVLRFVVLARDINNIPTKIRFYTDTKPGDLYEGIHIKQYDVMGELTFFSLLTPCPATITCNLTGLDWKIGKLVKVPGDIYNSFIRVTEVDASGSIVNFEIIEVGYNHTEGQEYLVSPWLYEPEIGAPERAAWVASRARFIVGYSTYGANKGYWQTEDGHISNSVYRLQDNFFYQNFSYLVKTGANTEQTDAIIKINHPAGLKYFKQTELESGITYSMTGDRSMSLETIYLYDEVLPLFDALNITLGKTLDDSTNFSFIDGFDLEVGKIEEVIVSDGSSTVSGVSLYSNPGYMATNYVKPELFITLS